MYQSMTLPDISILIIIFLRTVNQINTFNKFKIRYIVYANNYVYCKSCKVQRVTLRQTYDDIENLTHLPNTGEMKGSQERYDIWLQVIQRTKLH